MLIKSLALCLLLSMVENYDLEMHSGCKELVKKYDLMECCSYPFPMPSEETIDTCNEMEKISDCHLHKCYDDKSKFFADGKIDADNVLKLYEHYLQETALDPPGDWLELIKKSIETCQQIAHLEDVLTCKDGTTMVYHAGPIIRCVMSNVFVGCPAKYYKPSDRCNEAVKTIKEGTGTTCGKTYGGKFIHELYLFAFTDNDNFNEPKKKP